MNVMHILWNGQIGGAERSVFQLAAYQHVHTDLNVAIGFGSAQGEFANRARSAGIPVEDFRMSHGWDLTAVRRVRDALRDHDVHHFHCPEPVVMAVSRTCRNVRRIYTHRAGVMAYSGKRALRYALVRALLRGGFTAVTGAPQAARAAERVLGIPGADLVESFNGIDMSWLQPCVAPGAVRRSLGVDDDTVLVGTAATLRKIKRIDWLIASGAQLAPGNWRIVVIGEGPDRERLEARVAEELDPARIVFTGAVSDIGSWLDALDVFVLPSGPEEGFGNAVVEAMAMGVPVVVCSDSPGLVAHVQPGVTGLVVSDVGEMSHALEFLIADRAVRREMGDAASHDVVAKYSMERCSEIFQAVYERPGDRIFPDVLGKVAV